MHSPRRTLPPANQKKRLQHYRLTVVLIKYLTIGWLGLSPRQRRATHRRQKRACAQEASVPCTRISSPRGTPCLPAHPPHHCSTRILPSHSLPAGSSTHMTILPTSAPHHAHSGVPFIPLTSPLPLVVPELVRGIPPLAHHHPGQPLDPELGLSGPPAVRRGAAPTLRLA